MPAVVSSVLADSIAEELEIETGDILLSIDGEKLQDMIDYNYLCKNELITVEIQKKMAKLKKLNWKKILMKIWVLFLKVLFLIELNLV